MSADKKPSKRNMAILFIQILVAVVSVGVTLYFHNANLQILLSTRRADISFLVETIECSKTAENVSVTISGYFRNEGGRSAIIREVRIIPMLAVGSSRYLLFLPPIQQEKFTQMLGWETYLLKEEQIQTLNVTQFVSFSSLHFFGLEYEIVSEAEPVEVSLGITYDYGAGVQEKYEWFSIKQETQ